MIRCEALVRDAVLTQTELSELAKCTRCEGSHFTFITIAHLGPQWASYCCTCSNPMPHLAGHAASANLIVACVAEPSHTLLSAGEGHLHRHAAQLRGYLLAVCGLRQASPAQQPRPAAAPPLPAGMQHSSRLMSTCVCQLRRRVSQAAVAVQEFKDLYGDNTDQPSCLLQVMEVCYTYMQRLWSHCCTRAHGNQRPEA